MFKRLFIRYLIALLSALIVLDGAMLFLMSRYLFEEWRDDIRSDIEWIAELWDPGRSSGAMLDWKKTHKFTRLILVDKNLQVIADSHPERSLPDIPSIFEPDWRPPFSSVLMKKPVPDVGWLIAHKASLHTFPPYFHLGIAVILLVIVVIVAIALTPFTRSLQKTFNQLAELADQVASGHFGKEMPTGRSDELGRLIQRFNRMSVKLAEAERLQTKLIHNVSHEFRTPLSRIRLLAETAAYKPEELPQHVTGIEREIETLDRLLGDLLLSARLDAASYSVELEDIRLKQWLEEVCHRLRSQVSEHDVDWRQSLPSADRTIQVDAHRLTQVFTNLVDNALEAVSTSDNPWIQATVELSDQRLKIIISDNGIGVNQEDIPLLFKRFYKIQTDKTRKEGIGLGLSIVKSIVEAHQGDITFESEPGKGSTVTISLPISTGL